MQLTDLGWNDFFQQELAKFSNKNLKPVRIAEQHKNRYVAIDHKGTYEGILAGSYLHKAGELAAIPSVGDWVLADIPEGDDKAVIQALLPRRNFFSRKVAGRKTEQQIAAANIETIFLVSGLDNDFNIRRIERYLAIAWESGSNPVIVLNKIDLYPDYEEKVDEIESIAFGIPVLPVSAKQGIGLELLANYLKPGKTAAFLGSSGVGKSSLINSLLGVEKLKTKEVREDDSRGRHTTTFRQLLILPNGALVIDTPGMREIQVWLEDNGLSKSFADVEELAAQCRFTDCRHEAEPGCAVKKAIEAGTLDKKRLGNYKHMRREEKYLTTRKDDRETRRQQKELGKYYKRVQNEQRELRRRNLK